MSVSKKHLSHYKRLVCLSGDVDELRKKLEQYITLCEVSDTYYVETSELDEDKPLTVIHMELLDAIAAIEDGHYDEE